MTTMITFRGKARPRRRTSNSALAESARLRDRLRAFAEELRTEVCVLRTEVQQRMEEEDGGHEH